MSRKIKYFCDNCKKQIVDGGAFKGKFHYSTAGIDRSNEKNYIEIIDHNGDKPDLCIPCLKKEIVRMLGSFDDVK